MKKEIYVVKRKSTKSEKEYLVLVANVGYREVVLTYDHAVIVEVSGLTFEQAETLKVDEKIVIGSIGK